MRHRKLWIWLLVSASALFACAIWFSTLHQQLIDLHEFRQTQTALSALFMQPGLDGLLNYQTPVLGAPWSIPFEFPLFQWLAHHLANQSGLNLSSSGRLISVLFGIACIWPATRLMNRAGLGFTAKGLFLSLYFTSSIYLYWNRAFLMESMALFFTLTSLDIYSQIRNNQTSSDLSVSLLAAGLAISLSLGLLVKATTALPALALMGGDWIWQSKAAYAAQQGMRRQLLVAGALAMAFGLLFSWTHHADALKQLNPFGAGLTSSELREWNFGVASQRLQTQLWINVVLKRMLVVVGAIPAAALLAGGLRFSGKATKSFVIACLFLALAPLLIFTNLHIVHDYYQAGNQIFLLMAIAASAAMIFEHPSCNAIFKSLTIAALAILITGNLAIFFRDYWWAARLDTSLDGKLTVGNIIQKNTPQDSAILVFGDDWSSAFAFHSQRRALTRPSLPKLDNPSALKSLSNDHFGGLPLGAVVSKDPIDAEFLDASCRKARHSTVKGWKEGWNVYLCEQIKASQG